MEDKPRLAKWIFFMVYIYQDESGDMGFDFSKTKTSSVFSVAFLIVHERRQVAAIVKKLFASLPKAVKRRNSGVLHAHHEKNAMREKLLRYIAEKDVKIASMRLDKRKVLLTGNSHELYANIVITLMNRLYTDGVISDAEDITLVVSRMNTSKSLNTSFHENVINCTKGSNINVDIVKPSDDKCLQAVDFISWALWQKYEKGNDAYARLIEDKVVREYVMYE